MGTTAKSFAGLLDKADAFHDMNVGFFKFDGKTFLLTIEDHSGVVKSTDRSCAPKVARISADGVSGISFTLDMAMADVIYEVVEPEPGKLAISMDNGHIDIEAESIDIQLCE